jgi:primosomal protein N' (replication factor Y) (superfamily II helicase)
MSQLFADCAIPLAVDTLFTYRVPGELAAVIRCGMRVRVPFGRRRVIGLVIRLTTEQPLLETRDLGEILDTEPVLSEELLRLSDWISSYYYSPPGEVIKAVLVQGALRPPELTVSITDPPPSDVIAPETPAGDKILRILDAKGPLPLRRLERFSGMKNLRATLASLTASGFITIRETHQAKHLSRRTEQWVRSSTGDIARWTEWLSKPRHQTGRYRRQASIVQRLMESAGADGCQVREILRHTGSPLSSLRTLERQGTLSVFDKEIPRGMMADLHESLVGDQTFTSNADQQAVINTVAGAIREGGFRPFLLHGVTGSGKTHVYIEAIRKTIALGKSAIVLVPEISLTPQIVRRFTYHFGASVAVMHSRMSATERLDAWTRARSGDCSVVIGPRSAVFAPLKSLGLIVVDEEHEPSYKQFDQNPRYHARDVAVVRAQFAGCTVLLGSATPSLESYSNAIAGKYTLLQLRYRVDDATLPPIKIVDMTEERRMVLEDFFAAEKERRAAETDLHAPKSPIPEPASISGLLHRSISDRLSRNEGIILLQNRRGYSPFIECPSCGYVEKCDDCNITLTYHLTQHHLRCHYCGKVRIPDDTCPNCASPDFAYRGFGTQRVEQELKTLFGNIPVIRMDLDTTSGRGSHDAMLKKFSEGKADILLGTQMVAKGLDFSRVTLVGVISADTQMLLPDFRSAERTFQLLTQVAGRAGRSTLKGEVIIQTRQPGHYCLSHVVAHDFRSFYEEESMLRKELNYPPWSRLVLVEFRGNNEAEVSRHAEAFGTMVRCHHRHGTTLGPAPAALARLRGQFRWQCVIKCSKSGDPSGAKSHAAIRAAITEYQKSPMGTARKVRMIIDMDPAGMM